MLSQRFVRLAAQRLLGIAPREAGSLQQASGQRVRENLAVLARHCEGTPAQPLHAEVERCWDRLDAELGRRLDPATLARIDTRASALLEAADNLVHALQNAAGGRALHIVNLCGRQRMHVQRLAKARLLAALKVQADGAPAPDDDAAALLREFEAGRSSAQLSRDPLRAGRRARRLGASRVGLAGAGRRRRHAGSRGRERDAARTAGAPDRGLSAQPAGDPRLNAGDPGPQRPHDCHADNGTDWSFTESAYIDNGRVIIGIGLYQGIYHMYKLVPL